jgi:hypothetical protein
VALPVAVEVAPPNAPRAQIAVMLAACSRAVADSSCVLAADVSEGGTLAVAIVTWNAADQVLVEVGLRQHGHAEWRSRSLSFGPRDELLERWRTVGFVVGILARGDAAADSTLPGKESAPRTEPAPASVASSAPAASKPSEPSGPSATASASAPSSSQGQSQSQKPEPSRRRERAPESSTETAGREADEETAPTSPASGLPIPAPAALDLGGASGPGLDSWRVGGVVRTRWPIERPLSALLTMRYLLLPSDTAAGLSGEWLTLAAGLAAVFGTSRADIALSVDARADYFRASASDLFGSGERQQSRWIAGVGSSIVGGWMFTRSLGLFLGGDVAYMFGTTNVEVRNHLVATDNSLRLALEGGVRVRLW